MNTPKNAKTSANDSEFDVQAWLQIRKEAALEIDPETAEVYWCYGETLDPYGVFNNVPEEYQQIGREYFARAPDSDIWVNFSDLPDSVRERLWELRILVPSKAGTFEDDF